jgi:hypothetical protein
MIEKCKGELVFLVPRARYPLWQCNTHLTSGEYYYPGWTHYNSSMVLAKIASFCEELRKEAQL